MPESDEGTTTDRRSLAAPGAAGAMDEHIATETQPEIRIDKQWQAAHLQRHHNRQITPKTISTATHERYDHKWVVGVICDNETTHQQRKARNEHASKTTRRSEHPPH